MFVWLTPLPCSCLCWNITTRSVLTILFEIVVLTRYSRPCSSSFYHSIYIWDFVYLPTYHRCVHTHMYVHEYVCMCMYFFSLHPHYNLLISCDNNAWNTADTQIYVMAPTLHSNSLPGLSSGNSPQSYHTFQRYVIDIKECQWLSLFSTRLRTSTFGNDILINYMLSSKVLN